MSDCVRYNGKTYRKEILFEKIREKPDFFTKKHDLSPADINKAVGENSDIRFSISNSNANFVKELTGKPAEIVETKVKLADKLASGYDVTIKDETGRVTTHNFDTKTQVVS